MRPDARFSGRPLRLLLFVALAAVCASPWRGDAVSDEAKRKYLEGVRLASDDECEGAVKRLREALRDDGSEGLRKFRGTGLNYDDYFPHYYLGTCLEKMGQQAEALKELQESDRQGAVKERSALYRSLKLSLQKLQAAAPATPVTVAQANPPKPTTAPPVPTAIPVPTSRPEPVKISLPRATTPPPVPTKSYSRVSPSPTAPPATPTPVLRPRSIPTPTSAPPSIARPTPEPRPTATPAKPDVVVVPNEAITELRSGIRSYFKGEYDTAIARLEPFSRNSSTARSFLAYSLASKYLLMGKEKDAKLIARARDLYGKGTGGKVPARDDVWISSAIKSILAGDRSGGS